MKNVRDTTCAVEFATVAEIQWFMKSLLGLWSFSFNWVNDLLILFDLGGSWSCLQGVCKNAPDIGVKWN